MILKPGEEKADFAFIQTFDDWFNSIRDKYLDGVKIFIDSPVLTMSLYAVVIIFTLGMFYLVPKGFLPTEGQGCCFLSNSVA